MNKRADKPLAVVPYDTGKSYDFFEDKISFENGSIYYKDIRGFGYLLSRTKNSIDFIPTYNSSEYRVKFDIGESKPLVIGKSASAPLFLKTNKQQTINLIFVELVKCIDALIAPSVFVKCMESYRKNGSISIGDLTITEHGIAAKSTFRTKTLLAGDYSGTTAHQGHAYIANSEGKIFKSISLLEINAPLLQPILDTLYSNNA